MSCADHSAVAGIAVAGCMVPGIAYSSKGENTWVRINKQRVRRSRLSRFR